MNALARIKRGRESWKEKAKERGEQLREARKAEKRHVEQIKQLKTQNKQLEADLNKKKSFYPSQKRKP